MNKYHEFTATTLRFGKKFNEITATNKDGEEVFIGCYPNIGVQIASCFPHPSDSKRRPQFEKISVLAQSALAHHPYNLPCVSVEPYPYYSDVGYILLYRATAEECTSTIRDVVYQPAGILVDNKVTLGPTPPQDAPLSEDFLNSQREKLYRMAWEPSVLSAQTMNDDVLKNSTLRQYLVNSDFFQPFANERVYRLLSGATLPPNRFNLSLGFVDKLYYSLRYLVQRGGSCHFHRLKSIGGNDNRFILYTTPGIRESVRSWSTLAVNPQFQPS